MTTEEIHASPVWDIRIAKRAGWRIRHIDGWQSDYNGILYRPDGTIEPTANIMTPHKWQRVWKYTTDVEAALSLIDGLIWRIVKFPGCYEISFWDEEERAYEVPLPLAICRAWWAYMDAQEGGGDE